MTGGSTTQVCPDCGQLWVCDPGGQCWCMQMPPVGPLAPVAGMACLCPCKLEALTKPARKCVQVRVEGRVQGVGFRAWTVRRAVDRGLDGWVANRPDGSVEAIFAGPALLVDAMVAACKQGPRLALVSGIKVRVVDDPGLVGFVQRG
jgi:acylphosphatase